MRRAKSEEEIVFKRKIHLNVVSLIILPFFMWITLYPAWANALDAFNQGQQAGAAALPNQQSTYDEGTGTLNLDMGGTHVSIDINEIFPGMVDGNDRTDIGSLYENNDAIDEGSELTVNALTKEETMTGEAYRAIFDGKQSASRPNIQNDPIWNTTDNVISDVLAGNYSDCNLTMSVSRVSKIEYLKDRKSCARMYKESECEVERVVTKIETAAPVCPFGSLYNPDSHLCHFGVQSVTRSDRQQAGSRLVSNSLPADFYFANEGGRGTIFSSAHDYLHNNPVEGRQDAFRLTSHGVTTATIDPTTYRAEIHYNYTGAVRTFQCMARAPSYECRMTVSGMGSECGGPYPTHQVTVTFDPHSRAATFTSSLYTRSVSPDSWSRARSKGCYSNDQSYFHQIIVINATPPIPPPQPPTCPPGGTFIPEKHFCLMGIEEHINDTPEGCSKNNNFCQNDDESWVCLIEDDARVFDGVMLTPEVGQIVGLPPLYPGDPVEERICWLARTERDCDFNIGPMDCWTDIYGEEQCPENDGENIVDLDPPLDPTDGSYEEIETSCEILENDGNCGFIRSRCVEQAEADGICYVFEDLYDCGAGSVPLDDITTTEEIVCEDDFICPGGQCVTHEAMPNNSFNDAAAHLQAAEYAMQDIDCDFEDLNHSPATTHQALCRVFSGDPYECKIALGGWSNCCDMPVQQDVQTYMDMLAATSKLKSSRLAGQAATQEGIGWGSWFEMGEGTSAYTSGYGVAQNAGSYYRIINGAVNGDWMSVGTGAAEMVIKHYAKDVVTDMARDTIVDTMFTEIKQQIMDKLAEWITELVGENIAGMIAGAAGSGGTQGAAQVAGEGTSQMVGDAATKLTGEALGQLIGSMVSFVMWVYMIYQIANIIVMLVYACEEEEIELSTKEAMGSCTYLGSYCKSEAFGGCIERRKTFCCYETPLSRIIMEQAKAQLAGSFSAAFGTASNPNCEGMTLEDMANINWDLIDMSEWLALLAQSGNLPSVEDYDFSMDGLTGSGSALNLNLSDGENTTTVTHEGDTTEMTFNPRPDALSRTTDRLNGVPLEQTNQELRQDLYEMAPDLMYQGDTL